MSFFECIHLRCPECGEVRDNPKATLQDERGNFRSLVNAASPRHCDRCLRNFAKLGTDPIGRPLR